MTKTMTPTAAFKKVRTAAEQIRNDETQTVGTVSAGDVVRQGDLYIVALGNNSQMIGEAIKDRQLAPGTTQGSRHVIAGEAKMHTAASPSAVAEWINRKIKGAAVEPALIGPIFVAGADCELQHPEHGNFKLPAGETFVTVYQRAFAEEVRRQQD